MFSYNTMGRLCSLYRTGRENSGDVVDDECDVRVMNNYRVIITKSCANSCANLRPE